jgi:hypothetical protein
MTSLIEKEAALMMEFENIRQMKFVDNEEILRGLEVAIAEKSISSVENLINIIIIHRDELAGKIVSLLLLYDRYYSNHRKLVKLNNVFREANVSKNVKSHLKGDRDQLIRDKQKVITDLFAMNDFIVNFGNLTQLLDVPYYLDNIKALKKREKDALETHMLDYILTYEFKKTFGLKLDDFDEKVIVNPEIVTNYCKKFEYDKVILKLQSMIDPILEYRIALSHSENITAQYVVNDPLLIPKKTSRFKNILKRFHRIRFRRNSYLPIE